MAGHRVLVSYDEQPMTCYGSNDTGHLYRACPMRRGLQETTLISTPTSWADIAASWTGNIPQVREDEEGVKWQNGQPERARKH